MIHVRIVQGGATVADLPEWDQEVPAVGDYIFHPPLHGEHSAPPRVAGCVRVRTWRTHDRSIRPDRGFVQTSHPYVELDLGA